MRALRAAVLLLSVGLAAGCAAMKGGTDYSDAAIKARVDQALAGRPELDMKNMQISVDAAVVTLSGLIPTVEQRRTIGALVKRVSGVEQVLNNLFVQE